MVTKKIGRQMDWNRRSIHYPMHLASWSLTNEPKIHDGEKTASSINAGGKTRYPHANYIPLSFILYQNQFKVYQRPYTLKPKSWNFESPDSRDSPQYGRKSLPATHPTRVYYPESTGNSKTQPQRINISMKK
jgi:hypothetical protein